MKSTFRGEPIDPRTAVQSTRNMIRMLQWVESFPNLPFMWMRIRRYHPSEYRTCNNPTCAKVLSAGRIVRLTIPDKKVFCCSGCHKQGYGIPVRSEFDVIPQAT
jgi:hypothetical protein